MTSVQNVVKWLRRYFTFTDEEYLTAKVLILEKGCFEIVLPTRVTKVQVSMKNFLEYARLLKRYNDIILKCTDEEDANKLVDNYIEMENLEDIMSDMLEKEYDICYYFYTGLSEVTAN